MTIICDTLEKKNKIGNEISILTKYPINSSIIVSPYISDLPDLINLSNIENLQIICNAESASCNPYTLLQLLKNKNIKIKSRHDIHAKIYVFDNIAFVTSANATNSGLKTGTIEAAVKLEDDYSIQEIKQWFTAIWNDNQTVDILNFDKSTWEKLKSNWNLSNKRSKKQSLYDLIVSKKIPENISFVFWYETKNTPDQDAVAKIAKEENIFELPDNNESWNYWIEDKKYSKKTNTFQLLKAQLQKYYTHTMINLKTDPEINKIYQIDSFPSRLLDTPITLKWEGKTLLLSLYRKDNINSNIIIDKNTTALLNISRKKNEKAWIKYLASDDGKFGFCSKEQLYKLVKDCILA
jgi:hypothetical protein